MYCYKSTGTQIKGTVLSSATNVVTLDTAAEETIDKYIGWNIMITAGTGKGQIRVITDYTAARLTTVNEDWTIPPNGTSEYALNETQFTIDSVSTNKNLIIPSSTTDPVSTYVPSGSLRYNDTSEKLQIGKNDNTWNNVGGSGGAVTIPGYIHGCIVEYVNATNIKVTTGVINVAGDMFTTTTVTSSFEPTIAGGVNYVYFDHSAGLTSGVATYFASKTPPAWNDTYQGWYLFDAGTTRDIPEATSGIGHTLSTFKLDPAINATANQFDNYYIKITNTAIIGEIRKIVSHTTGTNAVATLDGGFSILATSNAQYELYEETNGSLDRMVGFFYAQNNTLNILKSVTSGTGSDIIYQFGRIPSNTNTTDATTSGSWVAYNGLNGHTVAAYIRIPRTAIHLYGNVYVDSSSTTEHIRISYATNNTSSSLETHIAWYEEYAEGDEPRQKPFSFPLNFKRNTDTRDAPFYYRTNTATQFTYIRVSAFEITR
jgi:hypothetical protein